MRRVEEPGPCFGGCKHHVLSLSWWQPKNMLMSRRCGLGIPVAVLTCPKTCRCENKATGILSLPGAARIEYGSITRQPH